MTNTNPNKVSVSYDLDAETLKTVSENGTVLETLRLVQYKLKNNIELDEKDAKLVDNAVEISLRNFKLIGKIEAEKNKKENNSLQDL